MQRYQTVLISTNEAAAEETNEHRQRKQTSIHKEGKSTTHTTSRGNKNLCVQRSNLAQRGTQEQLRGETEHRRWSEREKQKERKKQSFERKKQKESKVE